MVSSITSAIARMIARMIACLIDILPDYLVAHAYNLVFLLHFSIEPLTSMEDTVIDYCCC